jgi:hypothetical protein
MDWKLKKIVAVAMAAGLLASCAQVPRQAFNAQGAAHVKRVVLAQQENQSQYDANVLGHPGMSFGLIGGLVAAADMQSKSLKLTAAVDPKETRVQERFSEKLKTRLEKDGYQATVVMLPAGSNEEQALAHAKQRAGAGADAIVLVDLYAGYWAAGPSTDYFPRMVAKVKTVDAGTNKVLYQDSISYGYTMPQAQTVHLASDPSYRFANIDALVANPVKTREGLYLGLDALADQIAKDLKQ